MKNQYPELKKTWYASHERGDLKECINPTLRILCQGYRPLTLTDEELDVECLPYVVAVGGEPLRKADVWCRFPKC